MYILVLLESCLVSVNFTRNIISYTIRFRVEEEEEKVIYQSQNYF